MTTLLYILAGLVLAPAALTLGAVLAAGVVCLAALVLGSLVDLFDRLAR